MNTIWMKTSLRKISHDKKILIKLNSDKVVETSGMKIMHTSSSIFKDHGTFLTCGYSVQREPRNFGKTKASNDSMNWFEAM